MQAIASKYSFNPAIEGAEDVLEENEFSLTPNLSLPPISQVC